MVMKSDHEKKLLEASKTFDGAISQKDVSSLTDLLAKDAILHHGGSMQSLQRRQPSAIVLHLKPGEIITVQHQWRACY